jgi:hypothetical protein
VERAEDAADLTDEQSEMFFPAGLDRANQVERIGEISF